MNLKITILKTKNINPVFIQALSREMQNRSYTINDIKTVSVNSTDLLEQINRMAKERSILILVAGDRLEVPPEVHDFISNLPLRSFPAIPSILAQLSTHPASAFTQSYAGRIGQSLFLCVPQQLELITGLIGVIESGADLVQNKKKPLSKTVIGQSSIVSNAPKGKQSSRKEKNTNSPRVKVENSTPKTVPPTPTAAGWNAAMKTLKLSLDIESAPLPEELASIPAAFAVFEQAGVRKYAVDPYGNKFGVFGFPDLHSPSSKVLIVRPGAPYPEIIALHRSPFKTGMVPTQHSGYLVSNTDTVEEIAKGITKRKASGDRIIAIESNAVYIQRNLDVIRWDGRRERDMGTVRQAIASLILQWSQR